MFPCASWTLRRLHRHQCERVLRALSCFCFDGPEFCWHLCVTEIAGQCAPDNEYLCISAAVGSDHNFPIVGVLAHRTSEGVSDSERCDIFHNRTSYLATSFKVLSGTKKNCRDDKD